MKKLIAVLTAASLLAGCVTVPPHSLSVQDVSSWKLVGVEGAIPDNARITWPKVEDEFVAAKLQTAPTTSVDSEGRTVTTPGAPPPVTDEVRRAARLHAQAQFTERARFHLEPLGATMTGQRPVMIRTTLHLLDVPSLGRQLVVGAATAILFGAGAAATQNQSRMEVSTEVVDAKTGAVLVSYPESYLTHQGGEVANLLGSPDPYFGDAAATMVSRHRDEFGRWLMKG